MANKFDLDVDSAAIACQAKEGVRLTKLDTAKGVGDD